VGQILIADGHGGLARALGDHAAVIEGYHRLIVVIDGDLLVAERGVLTVDVAIEIVNDGASITSVTITYVIPASGKNPEISVEIKAFYTYDLEIIRIDTNEG
jgi:hypothetical protein